MLKSLVYGSIVKFVKVRRGGDVFSVIEQVADIQSEGPASGTKFEFIVDSGIDGIIICGVWGGKKIFADLIPANAN